MTHEEAVSIRYATFDAFAIWFRLWWGREPTAREVWLYLATRTSEAPATTSSDANARIEELRKGLFEARDAMRVMANWVKKSDPAGHSWAVHMVDRSNDVLSGASAATVGEPKAGQHCVRCGGTFGGWCDCSDNRAVRAQQQAEPVADELTDALITAAGRLAALYDGDPRDCIKTDVMNAFYAGAQFAAQSGQRAGVADGWKLVPIEPTGEMRQAAYDAFIAQSKKRNGLVEAYRAALAAAPTPAAQEGEQP